MAISRAIRGAQADNAPHHRVDAAINLLDGCAVSAGVFRQSATVWREESLHRGLKVIVLEGAVRSRIPQHDEFRLSGPSLFLAWNTEHAQGADAFDAGIDQRYAMVSLPTSAIWADLGVDPTFLSELGEGGENRPTIWHGAADRDVRRISNQMRICPFDGAARRLYLVAKGLELAAIAMAQAARQCNKKGAAPSASVRVLDAAHEVKRRLLANLREVPQAITLAREFGVPTRKLNEVFRHTFGVSMARFVQEARMQRARELIVNSGMSVSEAAWHVGYAPAHFSVAFRRRFEQSPSSLC